MAGKKAKTRSARSRGLRTLQHQTLAPRVRHAIDTEAWFRSLIAERGAASARNAKWATKDQVHDDAIAWFLAQHGEVPVESYPARRTGDEDLTFWVDSKLMERVRRMAVRDGVKVARLVDAALNAYVRHQVSDQMVAFRARVQEQADKLYAAGLGRGVRATRTRRTRT